MLVREPIRSRPFRSYPICESEFLGRPFLLHNSLEKLLRLISEICYGFPVVFVFVPPKKEGLKMLFLNYSLFIVNLFIN